MANYQFVFVQQHRKEFWRLLRNGVVVGDGVTQSEARRNAASFLRSMRRRSGPSCPWPQELGEDGPIVDMN